MTRRSVLFLLPLLLWGLLQAGTACAATIRVTPGRNPVPAGESFQLTFTATGSVSGDPDFTPLRRDFRILGQSRNTSLELINGHFSHSSQWILTLLPRHVGTLTVPPIAFGSDHSPGLSLTVTARGTASTPQGKGNLLLQLSVSPHSPMVQSEIIYTIRLLHAVPLDSGTLSAPQVAGGNAIVKRLGMDRRYQVLQGGRSYDVVERRYAIFPQQSGRLTIPPVVFTGQLPVAGGSAGGFFGSFFATPQDVTRQLRSRKVTLQVRPAPAAFTGKNWLPATHLSLKGTWTPDPPRVRAGEPLTLTLQLAADGLTSGQLPTLTPTLPKGLQAYPDQPTLHEQAGPDGLHAERVEKIAIVPQSPGSYRLPAITLPWWNTGAGKMETARLAGITLHVLPAGAAPASPPAPLRAAQPAPAPVPQAPPRTAGAVTPKPIPPPPPAPPIARRGAAAGKVSPWAWLCLLLGVGWGATLLIWLLSRRRAGEAHPEPLQETAAPADEGPFLTQLQRACREGDPGAARSAVLRWGRARWPVSPPLTLEELATRVGPALQQAVADLNSSLYSRHPRPWQGGAALQQAVTEAAPAERRKGDAPEPGLAPLYPPAEGPFVFPPASMYNSHGRPPAGGGGPNQTE